MPSLPHSYDFGLAQLDRRRRPFDPLEVGLGIAERNGAM